MKILCTNICRKMFAEYILFDMNIMMMDSHATSTTASQRLWLLLSLCLCFRCLTYSYCLSLLINFTIGSSVDAGHTRYCSASLTAILRPPSIIALFKWIVLLHQLFYSLLANQIIAEIVELFQSIWKFTLFHLWKFA